jgi:Na+/H+ antiporter NhaC
MNARIILLVGVVAIAGYFIYNSTSQASSSCSGDWTDYFNPLCWFGNAVDNAENEVNRILIIVALVIVAVVGFLAFGPQTGHLTTLGSAALL